MTQRMALIIAAAITAFVLVFVGGILMNMAERTTAPAAAQAAPLLPASQNLTRANDDAASSSAPFARLSSDQAAQIALNIAPGAQLARTPELVNFQNTTAYEVVLDQGVVYLDANTGKVLFNATLTFADRSNVRGHEDDHHGERKDEDD